MEIDREKPVYVISVVAEMIDIPQQTLRIYEKAKLVCPKRTKQNTRLYSQTDVEKLQRIARLHQELGINLAGIEVILHMRQRMEQMQTQFTKFLELFQERLGSELNVDLDENSTDLVPLSGKGAYIMRLIDAIKLETQPEALDGKSNK
jgi:MerR family transcriptional regulator, heat shock protein HspR